MNFVFDVGNVLVDYTPILYLKKLFNDEAIADKLQNVIYKSPEWLIMDEGLLSHEEATEIFISREPELKNEIRTVMQNFDKTFTPLEDVIDLLPEIIAKGHDLYYLSNIHKEIRDILLDKNTFFELFKGGVFSCTINHIKPSPEIYRYFLKKYSLDPAKCIFFDDMKENVSAAEKEGIKGVLFTGVESILELL